MNIKRRVDEASYLVGQRGVCVCNRANECSGWRERTESFEESVQQRKRERLLQLIALATQAAVTSHTASTMPWRWLRRRRRLRGPTRPDSALVTQLEPPLAAARLWTEFRVQFSLLQPVSDLHAWRQQLRALDVGRGRWWAAVGDATRRDVAAAFLMPVN